jgi:predicted  nucleic acid-binding Zn-ribbon protein
LKELPEKNQQRIEELTEELANLEEQLEPANQLLQKKMEKVNQETKPYHAKKDSFKDELGALEAATGEAKSKVRLLKNLIHI